MPSPSLTPHGAPTHRMWSRETLTSSRGDTAFTVGGYEMRLSDFWSYCDRSSDDLPLYLFDKAFAEKAPELATQYDPPAHFSDDLFSLLGEDARPDYRWLIAGPARSGSSFHKDPNATSVRLGEGWLSRRCFFPLLYFDFILNFLLINTGGEKKITKHNLCLVTDDTTAAKTGSSSHALCHVSPIDNARLTF